MKEGELYASQVTGFVVYDACFHLFPPIMNAKSDDETVAAGPSFVASLVKRQTQTQTDAPTSFDWDPC